VLHDFVLYVILPGTFVIRFPYKYIVMFVSG